MQGVKRRSGTRIKRGRSAEPRIGTVTFNPGPDAEDRLRRLFTLLLGMANEARERREGKGTRSDHNAGGKE